MTPAAAPIFIVAGDTEHIVDWTAATVFVALREQLAALGVAARWRPDHDGPSGLQDCADDGLAARVDDLVERIIDGGATDVVVFDGAVRTLGELRPAMDAELIQAIEQSADFISPQRLLGLYLTAHRERYGAEFREH